MTTSVHDPLRPQTLDEFRGQPKLASQVRYLLSAALEREQMPDHILLYGPPGLGKTSLAAIIARTLEATMAHKTGPSLDQPVTLARMLTRIDAGTVVFIDEIHAMPLATEETLLPALEDGRIDLPVGDGDQQTVLSVPLPAYTMVGATTQIAKIHQPLRDRFGFVGRLVPYETDALSGIVARSARLLDVAITDDAATRIAERASGTPRRANKMLRLVRDWAQVEKHDRLTVDTVEQALSTFGIDALGLDGAARDVLAALCDIGHPVGLNHLATVTGEPARTIEDVHEPQLMRYGLVARTAKGRIATLAAYEHLQLDPPTGAAAPPASNEPMQTTGAPRRAVGPSEGQALTLLDDDER